MRGLIVTILASLSVLTAGCSEGETKISGSQGMPLRDLDMHVPAPASLALHGPDSVIVREGDEFQIAIDGLAESANQLRFSRADGTLVINRYDQTDNPVTIKVTMPAVESVSMAGNGQIRIPSLAEGGARITIAGSGQVTANNVTTAKLDIRVGGSGSFTGSGRARALNLDIAGSGSADMQNLSVELATVTITGSGNGRFASDGAVTATIVGSGHVDVLGSANCEVKKIGSGRLNCETS